MQPTFKSITPPDTPPTNPLFTNTINSSLLGASNSQPERLRSCNNCRKTHSKCDSKIPCANCALHGLTCEYAFRKKRTKKLSEREKQIQSEILKLKSEIDRLRHSEKYWQDKYQTVRDQRIQSEEDAREAKRKKPASKGIVLRDNRLFLIASIYNMTHVSGFFKGCIPEEFERRIPDLLGRVQEGDSSVETKDLFLLYALLASCFTRSNDRERSKEYTPKAFEYLNLVINKSPNITVACGLALMVQLCFSSGDLDKVKTYAKLSKTMFEQLHEQHHPLYKHAVLLQIFCETTYKGRKQLIKAAEDSNTLQQWHDQMKFVIDVATIHTELEKEGDVDMSKILQLCDRLQDPQIKKEYTKTYMQNTFYTGLLESTLTRAFLKAGLHYTALEHAAKIQQLFANSDLPGIGPVSTVLCIIALCDTHLTLSKWKELENDIAFARKASAVFPVTGLIAAAFDQRVSMALNGNLKSTGKYFKPLWFMMNKEKQKQQKVQIPQVISQNSMEVIQKPRQLPNGQESMLDMLTVPAVNLLDELGPEFGDLAIPLSFDNSHTFHK